MFRFDNKNIFITGSTRGIGLALALGFKEQGANVIIHGQNTQLLEQLRVQYGFKAICADLSTMAGIQSISSQLMNYCEHLDILINNAGFEIRSAMVDISVTDYQKIMHINLHAPYFIIQSCLPLLKKTNAATIINVSSVHESLPCAYNSVYCMAKSGLKMMTQTLSVELAQYGIRINNISPGAIETDMNRNFIEKIGRDKFNNWITIGRVAQADELIAPVMFLASAASSYMTGSSLQFDGGLMNGLVPYAQLE